MVTVVASDCLQGGTVNFTVPTYGDCSSSDCLPGWGSHLSPIVFHSSHKLHTRQPPQTQTKYKSMKLLKEMHPVPKRMTLYSCRKRPFGSSYDPLQNKQEILIKFTKFSIWDERMPNANSVEHDSHTAGEWFGRRWLQNCQKMLHQLTISGP